MAKIRTAGMAFVLITTMLLGALLPATAKAVAGPIGAGIAGKYIIDKAKDAASELLQQGEQTGNLLASRFGNELNVAADNATRLLGYQIDREVDHLDESMQTMLIQLDELTKRNVTELRNLSDAVTLDLKEVMRTVPLAGENFYIQRIKGVAQLYKKAGDYSIEVAGVGLGTPSEKLSSDLKIMVTGKEVPGVTIAQTQASVARLIIPGAFLSPMFSDSKVRFLKMTLEIDQKIARRWWFGYSTEHYSIPISVALIPNYAGKVKVAARVPQFQWVTRNDYTSREYTTPDMHNKGNYSHQELVIRVAGVHNPPIIGDQRIIRYRRPCVAGKDQSCAFMDSLAEGIFENGAMAKFNWRANSHPSTWRLIVDIEEYTGATPSFVTKIYDLRYGDNLIIDVASNSDLVTIDGATIFDREIHLVAPQGDTSMAYTRTINENLTGIKTYVYNVPRPTDID